MKTKTDQVQEALSVLQGEQPRLSMQGLGRLLQPRICGNKTQQVLEENPGEFAFPSLHCPI